MFLAIDQSLPASRSITCEEDTYNIYTLMNIIDQFETRRTVPKNFRNTKQNAIATLTLPLHNKYNKYINPESCLFMKQRGKVIRTWRKACRNTSKYFPSNSQPFVSLYLLSSEYLSEQPQGEPLQRPAKRQDALVSKASARAVSTALRMECVDNVDERELRAASAGDRRLGMRRR